MKAWKIVQIVGFLILVVGVVMRVGGEYYGVPLAVTGLLVYALGKVVVWLKSNSS